MSSRTAVTRRFALTQLLRRYGLEKDEAAYVGDDINDLPAFDVVGTKIAVADASELLKSRADWVTPRSGGRGAVRDAVEEILRRQGRLEEAVTLYLAGSEQADGAVRQ